MNDSNIPDLRARLANEIASREAQLPEIDAKLEAGYERERAARAALIVEEEGAQKALNDAAWEIDCFKEGRRVVQSEIDGLKARLEEAESQAERAAISQTLETEVTPAAVGLAAALHRLEASEIERGAATKEVGNWSARLCNAWPSILSTEGHSPQNIGKSSFGVSSLLHTELVAYLHAMACEASGEAWSYRSPLPLVGLNETGAQAMNALRQANGVSFVKKFAGQWPGFLERAGRPDLAAKVRESIESPTAVSKVRRVAA